ncbi:kinase-like domain-containing protein [Ilyonectria destructans]|nr:kinase-like domain-containing protein [Ilyonectria destructans]
MIRPLLHGVKSEAHWLPRELATYFRKCNRLEQPRQRKQIFLRPGMMISYAGRPVTRASASLEIIRKQLRSGQFGVVQKAVDADTGKIMAVKILKRPTGASERKMLSNALKREVETLSRLSHSSQYHFQLGDFGFCNRAGIAAAFAGSPLYMAPEMFQKGGQTHKVDIWSLCVAMLWTLDVRGFRRRSDGFRYVEDAQKAVLSVADAVSNIQEMSRVNLEERASAA